MPRNREFKCGDIVRMTERSWDLASWNLPDEWRNWPWVIVERWSPRSKCYKCIPLDNSNNVSRDCHFDGDEELEYDEFLNAVKDSIK